MYKAFCWKDEPVWYVEPVAELLDIWLSDIRMSCRFRDDMEGANKVYAKPNACTAFAGYSYVITETTWVW